MCASLRELGIIRCRAQRAASSQAGTDLLVGLHNSSEVADVYRVKTLGGDGKIPETFRSLTCSPGCGVRSNREADVLNQAGPPEGGRYAEAEG